MTTYHLYCFPNNGEFIPHEYKTIPVGVSDINRKSQLMQYTSSVVFWWRYIIEDLAPYDEILMTLKGAKIIELPPNSLDEKINTYLGTLYPNIPEHIIDRSTNYLDEMLQITRR